MSRRVRPPPLPGRVPWRVSGALRGCPGGARGPKVGARGGLRARRGDFFNEKASTTTIPAQLVKKYRIPVVPIFIERFDDIKFRMTINKPINFEESKSVEEITNDLNKLLENMILKKPNYWIWSHNRWK